ncbi:MAG TPA: hypothetical protein VHC69_06925 [Polyangiaceae bacterium]|nr:hypothetical protein [Polyangiaceae bacterium]
MCGLATACGSAPNESLFSSTGGPLGSGGAAAGGVAAGNGGSAVASGGKSNATGGQSAAGGFVAAGGAVIQSGGASSGGATESGGAIASGGTVDLAGETGAGGLVATGGTGSGGVLGAGGATVPLATCNDRIKNQDETDVDCGGAVCPPCVPGQICKLARDCSSGVCPGALLGFGLCRVASCADKTQNGSETDVDCGGSACEPCSTGKKCLQNSDCTYGNCSGGVCTCTPLTCKQMVGACGPNVPDGCGNLLTCESCALLCNDSMKDGNETAVDCGGPDCGKCPNGSTCTTRTDCQSDVCGSSSSILKTCQTPTCTDTVKNGDETDVDCGGSKCAKCQNGKKCGAGADCVSTLCTGGVCACKPLTCADYPTQCGSLSNGCAATMQCACSTLCMDTKTDGHETDVDCGGGDCAPCMPGQTCKTGTDCASGMCVMAMNGGSGLVCQ